jgi:transposase
MHRYELTDAQWACIAPFFPDRYHDDQPGHPWWTHRRLVNGILWHLHTGAPWRDLPQRYGPWQTVYDRFNRWRKDGTWAKILDALLLQLDQAEVIERDLWCFDGTINRAPTSAAGAEKKSRAAAATGRA